MDGGTSLETHEEACQAYCTALGIALAAAQVYREVHSGAELWEWPALTALRTAMRAGDVQVIVAYAMDRLSRYQHHLSLLVGEVERHLLDPLRMLAPRENICVWASVHVNKTATAAGILRIALSREVTNTARSVGIAVEDPRDAPPGWRWRALAKTNLGATPASLQLHVGGRGAPER